MAGDLVYIHLFKQIIIPIIFHVSNFSDSNDGPYYKYNKQWQRRNFTSVSMLRLISYVLKEMFQLVLKFPSF